QNPDCSGDIITRAQGYYPEHALIIDDGEKTLGHLQNRSIAANRDHLLILICPIAGDSGRFTRLSGKDNFWRRVLALQLLKEMRPSFTGSACPSCWINNEQVPLRHHSRCQFTNTKLAPANIQWLFSVTYAMHLES